MSLSSFTTVFPSLDLGSYATSSTISSTVTPTTTSDWIPFWERDGDAVTITNTATITANPVQVQDLGECFPHEDLLEHVIPPCIELEILENACELHTNHPAPEDITWHARCMCDSPFFEKWRGCQNCLFVHGFHDENDRTFWEDVIKLASTSLCSATPTAPFKDVFWSVHELFDGPFPTGGNTELVNRFPGDAAVANYYTPYEPDWVIDFTSESTSTTEPESEVETRTETETYSDFELEALPTSTRTYRPFPYMLEALTTSESAAETEAETKTETETSAALSGGNFTTQPAMVERVSGSATITFSILALGLCAGIAAF